MFHSLVVGGLLKLPVTLGAIEDYVALEVHGLWSSEGPQTQGSDAIIGASQIRGMERTGITLTSTPATYFATSAMETSSSSPTDNIMGSGEWYSLMTQI